MTSKEVVNNPVKVGDFVKVNVGGDQHSRSLIWKVVEITNGYFNVPIIKIKLISGVWTQYNKEHPVGTERTIRMTSVKKINVKVKARVV